MLFKHIENLAETLWDSEGALLRELITAFKLPKKEATTLAKEAFKLGFTEGYAAGTKAKLEKVSNATH